MFRSVCLLIPTSWFMPPFPLWWLSYTYIHTYSVIHVYTYILSYTCIYIHTQCTYILSYTCIYIDIQYTYILSYTYIKIYVYIYILFLILFHCGLSQDIECSPLCCPVGPCLSILHVTVCICSSQTSSPSLPHSHSPFGQPQVCSLWKDIILKSQKVSPTQGKASCKMCNRETTGIQTMSRTPTPH